MQFVPLHTEVTMSTEMRTQPASLLGDYEGDGSVLPPFRRSASRRLLLPLFTFLVCTLSIFTISVINDSEPDYESLRLQEDCIYTLNTSVNPYYAWDYDVLSEACESLHSEKDWIYFSTKLASAGLIAAIPVLFLMAFLDGRFHLARIRFKTDPTYASYWDWNFNLRQQCVEPQNPEEFRRLIAEAVAADHSDRSTYIAEETEECFLGLLDRYGLPESHPLRRLTVKDYIDTPSMPSGPPQG